MTFFWNESAATFRILSLVSIDNNIKKIVKLQSCLIFFGVWAYRFSISHAPWLPHVNEKKFTSPLSFVVAFFYDKRFWKMLKMLFRGRKRNATFARCACASRCSNAAKKKQKRFKRLKPAVTCFRFSLCVEFIACFDKYTAQICVIRAQSWLHKLSKILAKPVRQ